MTSSEYQVWKEQYEAESAKLIAALGRVTDGGVIESIKHIGSTSMPDMTGSPCIDIGMAVWPFPLEEDARSGLEALGFQVVDGFSESPQQRFLHQSGEFQLFIFEPGVKNWYDFVLISDYLRSNSDVRDEVSARKEKIADKTILFSELLPDAHQWWIDHYGFSALETITNEMKDAPCQWYVAGGWALDLFLGNVQRVHHDVDIIVDRNAQLDMQKYLLDRNWKLITPLEKRFEAWPRHMRLELPRHQFHAHRGEEFIDFLLADWQGVWHYRREPVVIRSLEKMSLRSESGISYLAPELVLLFKSRNTSNHERTKDQADFEKALPHLDPEQCAWLRWALTATTPEHPWIPQLTGT